MPGLPEGWEADYDGRRWFYKYKPTGHIQYHFPKEGDEFPDFIDSFSPAPDLAPEERLESQQQVRRYGSTTAAPARLSPKKDDGGYGMSATARPVSMTWDGGLEEESTVFQPESFMYLGPGTYTDVSPLAEEEEEAARRVVAGGIEGRVDESPSKVVSPLNSERTTPAQSTASAGPIAGEPVLVPPTVVEEIHEMPSHEPSPPPDPVGIIAEMPTDDTAQAHIEKHPPPIEMADNTVLAPIETAIPMAELPGRTSPTEKKKEEPQLAPGSLRNYSMPMQPLKIDKKPIAEAPAMVQLYKPGEIRVEIPPNPAPLRRSTFQPGDPMGNASPIRPPDRGHAGTPNVLSPPQVPPKRPLDEPSRPQIPSKQAFDQSSQASLPSSVSNNAPYIPGQEPELSHMPSVLKPARGKGPGQPAAGPTRAPQGHVYVPPTQGRHPPSMTPAPMAQQQRLEEPRMGIQRINTVPDSLPSQRPQSVIQNEHQGLPSSTANQPHIPKRPASVMPDMMGTQTQAQYQSPVDSVPPRGLPRSATAGPGTQFPPYPVNNLPYPDDRPALRREDPPYPEEPFVQKLFIPDRGPANPSPPPPNNRRHSSYSSAIVSPDSRHGSMSFPTQTPSPMEHSRRASTTSSSMPNYTPSPVSNTPSTQSFSPTPPSTTANQYPQGSYFSVQDAESQGYNTAARDVLRKQSLSRGVDPRGNSIGTDPANAQRGSPLAHQTVQGYNAVPQGLPHTQSLPQVSQINTAQQNQRPVAPTSPPQGQQSLGRIEEYEEVPIGTISRSSTASITAESRKESFSSSAQPSPMGSRRASWQAEGPRNVPPGQFQGQQIQIPQGHMGQPMPQGQVPQAAPMPPQNPKQLQRKPSQGSAHQPQGQQMPMHDPRVPQGMPQHQGMIPQGQLVQGQMLPPQAQGRAPQPMQINTQVQNAPQEPSSSVLPPKPVPMRLQKRSSYGPPSPAGQTVPPPNQLSQGPMPPSLKGQNQMPQQGHMAGQIPPQGQPNVLQKIHPGRVQPHVQIPQEQGNWQPSPHPVMPQNSRPVSMQPQSSQSAGSKEGKEGKKWLKWLKGGSKSVSHSPTTPVISSPISPVVGRPGWGGGEYSQQAVWQPGQPVPTGPQPGLQGNMPPPQQMQMQVQTQMPPQQAPMHPRPLQRQSHSFQTVHESNQMGFQPGQPSQMSLQPRQMPPQAGQLPTQKRYSPPQQVQTPVRQEQMAPPQNQIPSQPGQLSFQKRLSLQQASMPTHFNDVAPKPSQVPPPVPAPLHPQPEPQSYPVAAQPAAARPVEKPAALPADISRPVLEAPVRSQPNNAPHQQVAPPRQPSPGEVRPLEQASVPQFKAPEPTQPPQPSASNYLQPDQAANESLSPHAPAASPGHSDTATSPLSRMSSQKSYFSDAGSITTIEVAQAQPQSVLKPSIVQVKRKSTDMWRQSQEIQQNNGAQSSSDVTPRISTETPRADTEPALPPSRLQHQQTAARPEPESQMEAPKYNNTTAPLFSNSSDPKTAQHDTREEHMYREPSAPPKTEQLSPTYTNSIVPNEQNNRVIEVKANEVQPAPAKPAPVVEDKWAKKPVVDYSGGDWGDDDDWDY